MELLQNFYETTLEALKDAKNDRLWFKTNTKLGKLYFDRNDFGKLQKILKQLHQSCQVGNVKDRINLYIWNGLSGQSIRTKCQHTFYSNVFRPMTVKTIWKRGHNYWKFMLLKFKCTLYKRITRSSRHCTNNRYTSNRLYRIHWLWA